MSVEGVHSPRRHCVEEPDCIGVAFMQGNAELLRGKFLCVGHTVPEWMRRQKAEPEVPKPPLDRVPIGTEGWIARNWRYHIAEMERRQRITDAQRLHFTKRKERRQLALIARNKLPVLGPRDIRRHRLPLVQSLPLDLEDDGFPMTSSIIEGFIHYNNQMRAVAPKGSPFYEEPPIADKPDLLLRLATGISEVEAAGQCDPPMRADQIDKLLSMAVELRKMGETIYWVVEKLLLIACDIAAAHILDGHRREALSRYVYGHFLNEIKQLGPAVDQLEKGRCLALAKNWKMDLDMPKTHALLLQEIVDLQSHVLLRVAKQYRVEDPQRAIRFCSRALRRLGDPELAKTEAAVLLELGFAYKQDDNYPMARTALAMYLENFGHIVDPAGKCTAFLEVARCYSHLGDIHKAQEYLLKVLELAKNSGLVELTALALKTMGEGFLTIRYFRTASECLGKSFELYTDLNISKQMDVLRALAAISKGLEVMPLMSLLMNHIFETNSVESMTKLLSWRLHREPFWSPESDYAPKLPRKHLYTTVQIIKEQMNEEERLNLEQAKTLREQAVRRVRDEEQRTQTARRLMRAERMKSGAFVQVFHPSRGTHASRTDFESDWSDDSYSLFSDDSVPSLIGIKRLLLPDRDSSLSRITEEMVSDIKPVEKLPTLVEDTAAETEAGRPSDEVGDFQSVSEPLLREENKVGFGATDIVYTPTQYAAPPPHGDTHTSARGGDYSYSEAVTIPSTSSPFPEWEARSRPATRSASMPAAGIAAAVAAALSRTFSEERSPNGTPSPPTSPTAPGARGAKSEGTATAATAPRHHERRALPSSEARAGASTEAPDGTDPTVWRYPLTRNKGWTPTLPIAGRYPMLPLSERINVANLQSITAITGGRFTVNPAVELRARAASPVPRESASTVTHSTVIHGREKPTPVPPKP